MGLDTSDDAGVLRLNDDLAIIQTVDFFTPIVDDPYSFGQIAAANALSDVYAMGGVPVTAMNIICFPLDKLGIDVLQETLRGGLDKIKEAGALLVGGHSVEDKEFKYGLSLTGKVHPDRVLTNRGAEAGDRLVLTKPIGTGIINTAIKGNKAEKELIDRITEMMSALNREPAELFSEFNIKACTDVTGFGLIGHACEMIDESSTGLRLFKDDVPIIKEAIGFAGVGVVTGGSKRNRIYREKQLNGIDNIDPILLEILFDPQTSGGLLVALGPDEAEDYVSRLKVKGMEDVSIIGEFIKDSRGRIFL